MPFRIISRPLLTTAFGFVVFSMMPQIGHAQGLQCDAAGNCSGLGIDLRTDHNGNSTARIGGIEARQTPNGNHATVRSNNGEVRTRTYAQPESTQAEAYRAQRQRQQAQQYHQYNQGHVAVDGSGVAVQGHNPAYGHNNAQIDIHTTPQHHGYNTNAQIQRQEQQQRQRYNNAQIHLQNQTPQNNPGHTAIDGRTHGQNTAIIHQNQNGQAHIRAQRQGQRRGNSSSAAQRGNNTVRMNSGGINVQNSRGNSVNINRR